MKTFRNHNNKAKVNLIENRIKKKFQKNRCKENMKTIVFFIQSYSVGFYEDLVF